MSLRTRSAPSSGHPVASGAPGSRRSHVGGVVAGSLVAGFAAAVILPFLPVGTVDVDFATAMVLFGWALGWALMAVLSTRFTDQPQRWAVAPAIFMALSGALVLFAPDAIVDALGWVWPPALLVLVVWVWARARRELHSRTRVWLLNPVLVVLVLFALAGGYETIGQVDRTHGRDARSARRRGTVPTPPGVHRLTRSDRGSRARCGRVRGVDGADLTRCGPRQPSVRLRPGGAWLERSGCDSARWCADRDRPAQAAGPCTRSGSVRAGRAFLRRPVRPDVRREVSRGGRRTRPGRLHRRQQQPRVPARGRLVRRLEARVLVGRNDLSAGAWSGSRRHQFSELPPKYRDDARATAATAKEMGGVIDEYGVANRSEPRPGNYAASMRSR